MAATAPHYALEQAQHAAEARHRIASNMVPLAPGVVIPAGNPVIFAASEAHGVTCLEVEVDELVKGVGSVHCITGVSHRLKEVA